ncbi:MAG: glycosyltransferase, partial [Steroidobacterales bacterium]
RGLLPSWDNTARRQDNGTVFTGSSPELFEFWLEHAVQQTRVRHRGDERMLFINAWNEWGEGCHLEPDQAHGRAYLEAVASALAVARPLPAVRPSLDEILARAALLDGQATVRKVRSPGSAFDAYRRPRVSVVMPAYNHERFVGMALDSIVAQTFEDLEIIVIDDGSTDGTAAILDVFAAQCASHAVTVVHQPNEGAHAAINHGLALARGEIIAVINSDDSYFPRRLERLLVALCPGTDLAFSDVAFIGSDDRPVESLDADQLRQHIDDAASFPSLLYPLIERNIATSTGNLVFRRALLHRIGGFAPLSMCHDWDFVLAATYATRVEFVPERLYRYRMHGGNTFSVLSFRGQLETEQVLHGFFAGIQQHPWLDDEARAAFLSYASKKRLGGLVASRPAGPDFARPGLTGA